MNYTDKLKKENKYLTFAFWVLLAGNMLMTYAVVNKYQDNEYLVAELNKTQKEKADLLIKLKPYEHNEGK